jgi:hypothetical protein
MEGKELYDKSVHKRNVSEKNHAAVHCCSGVPGALVAAPFVGRGGQDGSRAQQIGIRGFAMKPLDKSKLARAVRMALDS